MRRSADAGGSKVQLAGLRFRQCDEVAHSFHGHIRMRHQKARRRADETHGHEDNRVIRKLLVQPRIDGERRGAAEQQRISIGNRTRRELSSDNSAGAAAIVDHHLLANLRGQPLGDQAAEYVIRAAGRKRYDHAYCL